MIGSGFSLAAAVAGWNMLKKAKERAAEGDDAPAAPAKAQTATAPIAHEPVPEPIWRAGLTRSIKQNLEPPTQEAIAHAFDQFCDELIRPFRERKVRREQLEQSIVMDLAMIDALAPDLSERARANAIHLGRFNQAADMGGGYA